MPKHRFVVLIAIFVLFPITNAFAVAPYGKTPEEEAMCNRVVYQGRDTSNRANWQHMHHFCDCIRFQRRAVTAKDASDVRYNLDTAISNCDYVLAHTSPDFYMRAEVHLQKARALRLAKRETQSMAEYFEAIKGNPDLIAAYGELADIQAKMGIRPEALNTVSEGLRRSPESKSLQRRYTELGGKPPFPEPLARTEPDAAQKPRMEVPAKSEVVPAAPIVPLPSASSPTETVAPGAPTPTPVQQPKKKPNCRFCPD